MFSLFYVQFRYCQFPRNRKVKRKSKRSSRCEQFKTILRIKKQRIFRTPSIEKLFVNAVWILLHGIKKKKESKEGLTVQWVNRFHCERRFLKGRLVQIDKKGAPVSSTSSRQLRDQFAENDPFFFFPVQLLDFTENPRRSLMHANQHESPRFSSFLQRCAMGLRSTFRATFFSRNDLPSKRNK